MTEVELLKALTKPNMKEMVWINPPFISKKSPGNLKGYYLNKTDKTLYFYGEDKMGFNIRVHHSSLQVVDYTGAYRNLIKVEEGDYHIRLRSDIFPENISLPMPIRGTDIYKVMSIDPKYWKPGDFFQEDDGTILESIIGISISDKARVVTFNPLTLESEVYTYSTVEELEDHIFTLIPLKV